jgi:universal stress protein A
MKTILHPTDFSSVSRSAFKKAIELAKGDRVMLELLHVITPVIPVPGGNVPRSTYNALDAAATTSARKRMEELVKQAHAADVKTKLTIVEGRPADRIVRAARANRADLIVMGTHGRTGLSRLLLGSVAARVISHSPCPVLTVRGKP